ARSARQAKETPLVDRFLLDAVPDLLLLRGDLPAGYASTPGQYARALLDVAGDAPARGQFLEKIAETQPEALLEALSDDAKVRAGLPPDDLKALLDRAVASAASGLVDPETFVRQLRSLGRAREAAEIYL